MKDSPKPNDRPAMDAPWFALAQGLLLFAVAFFPDEKLARPKLLAFELGLYALFAGWVLASIWRGTLKARVSPALWAAAAWCAYAGLAVALGDYPDLAAAELRRALLGLGAFWAGLQLADEPARRTVRRAWGAAAAVASLYGVLQFTGGVGLLSVPRMDRVMSTFGNPIFFATFLAVSVPLIASLAAGARGGRRAGWLAVLALALAALYLARTRAAWIGLAAAAAAAALLLWRGDRRKLFGAGAAAVVLAAVFAWATRSVWARDQAHLLIWRDTVKLWLGHPLFGVGAGEFHIQFPSAAGADLIAKWPPDKFIVNFAHNEYLQLLAESGLVGLLLWLAPLALVAARWRRKTARTAEDVALAAALAAGLAQAAFSVDLRFSVSYGLLMLLAGQAAGAAGAETLQTAWRPTWKVTVPLLAAALWALGLVVPERTAQGWSLGVAGAVQVRRADSGWTADVLAGSQRAGLLARLLHPYAAQRRRAATPDFFDQKLLDPARTVADLEVLAAKFPDEASVFEKLGYALAKEIRVKDESGKSAVNADAAGRAVRAFERAGELDPARAGVFNNLGNIHFTLGDQRRAMEEWSKAVAADPGQVDARLNMGKVLYLNGRLREAADQFRKVLELRPGNDEATVYLKKMVE